MAFVPHGRKKKMLWGPSGCPGWGVVSHHTWAHGHRGHKAMPSGLLTAPVTLPGPCLLPSSQASAVKFSTRTRNRPPMAPSQFRGARMRTRVETGTFLKSRELKLQSRITLVIPRLKTFFRNWLIRGHASCVVQAGGGRVSGALSRGQAGEMIIKYVK